MLTAGTDNLVASDYELGEDETEADVVRTTANNDTFVGVTSALSSAQTFDVTDVIDGGDGNDTLTLTMNTSFAGFSTGSMSNVETVNITNVSSIVRTFNAEGVTGVETYNIDATTNTVELTELEGAVTVNLSNQADGNFTTAFNADADEVDGSSDAMTVGLTNVGTADDADTDDDETAIVDVTIADIEALTLNLSGVNVVDLAGTDLEDLVIIGDGSLEMATVSTSLETVDASEATGDLDLNLEAVATVNQITSVVTGSGDDTVTIDANTTRANAAIDGGAGEDTLVLGTMAATKTVQYAMGGFENLELGALGSALTFSGKNTSGLDTIIASSALNAAATFVNMGSGDFQFTAEGQNVNTVTITSTHTGASTITTVATDDALEDQDATETNNTSFTLSQTSSLTLNVGAYTTFDGVVTAADAEEVVINVASGLDEDDLELTALTGDITVAAAASIDLNAIGQVERVTITAAAAEVGTFTFGDSANDDVAIDAEAMVNVTITAGADLDLAGSDLSAAQTVTLTAGDGLLTVVDLVAVNELTISGSDGDAQVTLGDLGADNEYNMTIEASGLDEGLGIGTIDVGAGNDIDGTFDDVTGDVTIDDIGDNFVGRNVTLSFVGTGGEINVANVAATDTVTVTASGASTFDIGDITADNVELELDGQLGAVTLAKIDATTVTINAADTIAGVAFGGDITIGESAVIVGSELEANNIFVVAGDAATELTLDVTGGIGNDDITFTGDAATISTTITGDLGIGSNSLVVDNILSNTDSAIDISGLSNYDTATITGGDADDTIIGGDGDDIILAGTGTNTLTGGDGDDSFIFAAETVTGGFDIDTMIDTVTDFSAGDQIGVGTASGDVLAADSAGGFAADATGESALGFDSGSTATGEQEVVFVADGIATFFIDTNTVGGTGTDAVTFVENEGITLLEALTLLDTFVGVGKAVIFENGDSTYLFVAGTASGDMFVSGNATSDDTVIELVGISALEATEIIGF